MDFLFEKIVMPLIMAITVVGVVGLAGALFIGVPWYVYDYYKAEKFSLRYDQWHCSSSHQETSTIYVNINNVMIPQTSTSNVCDQWSRR